MNPTIESKTWDPKLEKAILEEWNNSGIYQFESDGDNFVIDTPPPYPSGRPWHVGAAAHYAQIDMIARTARMSGKNVYFPIGIDRNGLPVELYTEKKHDIRMHDTDRKEFIDLCKTTLDDLESEMLQILKNLGISGDFENYYQTDSEEYRKFTQSTFIQMWNDDRIYLANRPNNYDWVSGTTIADAEIIHIEMQTKLVHMRFSLVDSKDDIIIASTRPELLCACQAVIVNPKDQRYAHLLGKKITIPLINRKVSIIPHPSAKEDFGSGAVMVCSFGDQNDVALFRELRLPVIIAIGLDGKMTKEAGVYEGLRPKQARAKIIQDLQDANFLTEIQDINHRTPVSERSKNPIEIIPMEEYYLKQQDSIDDLRKSSDTISFYPPMHRIILQNWFDSISIDWPISRRRYYATEIPVWYCKKCSHPFVPKPGKYYRPWLDKCPAEKCSECDGVEFEGETRTLDTWMDSSVSPLFISKFGRDEEFFKKTYPASIRPQAKDIVRTWLYYTLLRCNHITNNTPWSSAWIMGYGLDERGLKMSKSKGNVLDPLPVIERIGADTFRFWSASEVTHGYDFRCSEQKMDSSKKFLSKLWNVARLISAFPQVDSTKLEPSDKWIISELNSLISECQKGYSEYNFFIPAVAIREFTRNIFAAHYIEMVKARAYGDNFESSQRDSAISTLHLVLKTILKLLAPLTPFITEYLWQKLYSKTSIHKQLHPTVFDSDDMKRYTKHLVEFNSKVWNTKKSQNVSLKESIQCVIPDTLHIFATDLIQMHNLQI